MNLTHQPLADKIRPKKLSDFVGQEHLVGKNGIINKLLELDFIPSMIFWGPPGSGKTTLGYIIANQTKSHFEFFSAVTTKVEDIRRVVREAKERLTVYNQKTILFLDEIHRFNKAQQAAFLSPVEKGIIILIGATTENPSFEVIGPLLSRCKVLTLNRLAERDLERILNRGLSELSKNRHQVRHDKIKIDKKAKDFLIEQSNGDARILLNALEIANNLMRGLKSAKTITISVIEEALQSKQLLYDKAAEEHYNTISAFIKALRASNPDAALYYLARMIEGGEDPLFIARRMVIFASEDIGMAQPTALVVANEVFRACETIGYPECAINLAHGVVYLAKAPKDRSAYDGLRAAQEDVKRFGNLPIPLKLRNPVTKLMKNLGYGKGYEKYTDKDLLPEKLKGRRYYRKATGE